MDVKLDFSKYPVANAFMRKAILLPLTEDAIAEAEALKALFGETPVEKTVFGMIGEAERNADGAISVKAASSLARKAIAQAGAGDFALPDFTRIVPDAVASQVKFAISALNDIRRGIDDAVKLEESVGMAGRYQADAFMNRKNDIASAKKLLDLFKERAPKNFVDPDLFIRAMGGEPDLTPSPEAQAWIDDPRGPVIAPHKFRG